MNNPIGFSKVLGRRIRQDGLDTLGISTQTLFEQALGANDWALASELVSYFWEEMRLIGEALYNWIEEILAFVGEKEGWSSPGQRGSLLLRGLRTFNSSSGDLARALEACSRRQAPIACEAANLMRLRWVSLHDALVAWIQDLLHDLSERYGEEAVFGVIEQAYLRIWKPRYARWNEMSPLEKLQLSVEGMRGHLSGPLRRGDVGLIEEPDRYVMLLDPCGSCGIMRRGDPESGRPPMHPAGNKQPHPWTWGRVGVSWYAVHSPIVMEYLWMREGKPPMRPMEDCDTDRPCRWYIYKDPALTRKEHYLRMGFSPPEEPRQ